MSLDSVFFEVEKSQNLKNGLYPKRTQELMHPGHILIEHSLLYQNIISTVPPPWGNRGLQWDFGLMDLNNLNNNIK